MNGDAEGQARELLDAFGERALTEAVRRALKSSRSADEPGRRFWIDVARTIRTLENAARAPVRPGCLEPDG